MAYTLRTCFKNEIIAEFLAPKEKTSKKVIILCDGLPTVPSKRELMLFLVKRGFWVFHPRYRGTWESGGEFLKNSPEQDVIDIISELPKGFKNLYDETVYQVNGEEIYVFGASFGGTVALLSARDARVKKVVALAPVADWNDLSIVESVESIDSNKKYTKEAFGEAYRFKNENWDKLKSGDFFNPVKHKDEIDGKKVMIICTKDDEIVPYESTIKFAKDIGAKIIVKKKGGHLSLSAIKRFSFWRSVKKFLV